MGIKVLIATLALASATAVAGPTPLQRPAGIAYTNPYRVEMIGAGFNADNSVFGGVVQRRYYPCSGRACQPASTGILWAAAWDSGGNVLSLTECATYPYTNRAAQWEYLPGFSFANCPYYARPFGVVTVAGVPYYLYAASVDGLYLLVNGGILGL